MSQPSKTQSIAVRFGWKIPICRKTWASTTIFIFFLMHSNDFGRMNEAVAYLPSGEELENIEPGLQPAHVNVEAPLFPEPTYHRTRTIEH